MARRKKRKPKTLKPPSEQTSGPNQIDTNSVPCDTNESAHRTTVRKEPPLAYDATQELIIPLDRLQAFVRFVWRGAVGAGCMWLGRSIWPGPDYQTIVYLSFLIFAFSIALAGLMFAMAAVRWLALALWPGVTRIKVTNERIDLHTGAFGHDSFAWSDIDVELEGNLEADIYESLPAESIVPTLRHRPTDHNVFGSLQTYSGHPAENLAAQIKPFVLQRLRVQEAAQA